MSDYDMTSTELEARLRGWQPIETAPKDKQLLLWHQHENLKYIAIGEWSDSLGWGECLHGDYYGLPLDPTHWMPLPEPPQ